MGGFRNMNQQKRKKSGAKQALINAGIHELSEYGVSGLRITRLVEHAGATTGAIQYHFGGREELLVAILEDTMGRFSTSVLTLEPEGSIDDRLVAIQELVLSPGSHRLYKVMINLVVGSKSSPALNKSITKLMKIQMQTFEQVWLQLFSDLDVDQQVLLEIGYSLRMSIWGTVIESEFHESSFFQRSLSRIMHITSSSIRELMV